VRSGSLPASRRVSSAVGFAYRSATTPRASAIKASTAPTASMPQRRLFRPGGVPPTTAPPSS
jgi:hypothetical protein